jgi:hypothetical protein
MEDALAKEWRVTKETKEALLSSAKLQYEESMLNDTMREIEV